MIANKISLHITFILFLSLFSIQHASAKKEKQEIPKAISVIDSTSTLPSLKSAVVAPFKDTLFTIYGNLGAMTAQQRAKSIEENIKQLGEDMLFSPDSLQIVANEFYTDIAYGEKIILSVTDKQAKALNKTKESLANEYRQDIINAIQKEKDTNYWLIILKQVGLALLIIVGTWYVVKYLNIFYTKIRRLIKGMKGRTIKKLYNIIDAEKQILLVLAILKVLRFVLFIWILYIFLLMIFRLFPETTWLSDTLIDYIYSPFKKALSAIRNFIPNLFSIIVIVSMFKFIAKGLSVIAVRIKNGDIRFEGFYPDWAMPTYNIIKVILYVFMFIFIFPYLPGSESPAFQGVSVFLGVLFSLGSTSIISNMVSGIVITYMRSFKIGDRIRMGDAMGNVIEKTPLVTRIKTPKNEIITIPNGNILTAQTINYTTSAEEYGLILYSKLTMGYDIPWRKVHELLLEASLATPDVLSDPKPFILQIALDDFYVEYQVNIYTKEPNKMAAIYSDLNKNIQDVFHREGIEIMSPHIRAVRGADELFMPKENILPTTSIPTPINVSLKGRRDKL